MTACRTTSNSNNLIPSLEETKTKGCINGGGPVSSSMIHGRGVVDQLSSSPSSPMDWGGIGIGGGIGGIGGPSKHHNPKLVEGTTEAVVERQGGQQMPVCVPAAVGLVLPPGPGPVPSASSDVMRGGGGCVVIPHSSSPSAVGLYTSGGSGIAGGGLPPRSSIPITRHVSTGTMESSSRTTTTTMGTEEQQQKAASSSSSHHLSVQRRMVQLFHSSKCGAGNKCHHMYCVEVKVLWRHLTRCKERYCTTPHCQSSRLVLNHFRKCREVSCVMCGPVRHMRKQKSGGVVGGGGGGSTSPNRTFRREDPISHEQQQQRQHRDLMGLDRKMKTMNLSPPRGGGGNRRTTDKTERSRGQQEQPQQQQQQEEGILLPPHCLPPPPAAPAAQQQQWNNVSPTSSQRSFEGMQQQQQQQQQHEEVMPSI